MTAADLACTTAPLATAIAAGLGGCQRAATPAVSSQRTYLANRCGMYISTSASVIPPLTFNIQVAPGVIRRGSGQSC